MRPEFQAHELNEEGFERARAIGEHFSLLLVKLETECSGLDAKGEARSPDPRLMALVRTKLEEACFFAKKAMASMPSNQRAPS